MGSDSDEEEKMVKILKEILHDRSEPEIYAALKECGMNPHEALDRLLLQGTFEIVKSKRERRKEMREMKDTGNPAASLQPPTESEPCSPVADTGKPPIFDIVRSGSMHTGSSKFSKTSLNHQDEEETFDEHNRCGTLNSAECSHASSSPPMEIEGVAVASNSDASCKRTNFNHEKTWKTGSQEAASDVHGISYLEELHPEQTAEDVGGVKFPSHMQTLSANCSHLCFGTFNSESSSSRTTGLQLPHSTKINLETLTSADNSLSTHPLCTNEKYQAEVPGPLSTQQMRQQMLAVASGDRQISNVSDLVSEGSVDWSNKLKWEQSHGSSQGREEVPQCCFEMREHLKCRQGDMLLSDGQAFTADSLHPQGLETPPELYNAAASSCRSSMGSILKALPPDTFPPLEPSSRASLASHWLQDQLLRQAYPQQTNPLEQYANLKRNQIIPQNYEQIPLHQSSGSTTHDLPLFQRDDAARNLPMPSIDSSGFDCIASNLSAAAYNNMLQNQIMRDTNHFQPHVLDDPESIGRDYRVSGPGTISTARENAYYNLLLEQERNLRYQQTHQNSQSYGSLGNSRSYQSQIGGGPDNQLLHIFGDMTLNNRAGSLSKQNQFWPPRKY